MTGRKTSIKTDKVKIYGSRGGVFIQGLGAAQVRKAIKLLGRCTGRVNATDARMKTALKFFDVTERFFKNNGRFKRKYTRKKK